MKMEWYMLHTSFCLLLLLIIHQPTTTTTVSLASTGTTSPNVSFEGTTSTLPSTKTATTTIPVTTTQSPMIGGHCENSSDCANLNNAECINNSCLCRNDSFNVNNRTCFNVSDLKPKNASLVVDMTFITLKWSQYSDPVGYLIKNGTLEIVVKGKELSITKCSVNISEGYANCTDQNLTHGTMYTLHFSIIQVQSNETVYSISFSDSSAPGKPGAINTTSDFHAPNINLTWEASPGLVDNYTVTITEVNENKTITNITLDNSTRIEVTGLRHGRNHTVVIVANRFDKTSDQRTDNFSTVIISPEPPINVTVMPGSVDKDNLTLTWTRPVDFNGPPLGYKVCVRKQIYLDEPWSHEDCITKHPEIAEQMKISNLTAGAFYWFTVYSLNSKYNSTPANLSNIQTNESTPDVVTNVNIAPFDFKMEVNFTRPERPFGIIVGYNIIVTNSVNNSDCQVWWLQTLGFTVSGYMVENWKNCSSVYPPINITMNQMKMSISVTELFPDTSYWIVIMAQTKVGLGTPFNITINTNETVPGSVSNLMGNSISSTEITVHWIAPVIRPGKTVYHVEVRDMIVGNIVQNVTANGYTNQSLTVRSLQEYWVYQFIVYASTSKGTSSVVISDNVTTEEAAPGAAIDLDVIYYNGNNCDETMVNITWKDPKLEDRNGKIVAYVIEITKGIVKTYRKNITDPDPYSNWSQTWWEILEILPDREYDLQVQAITETKKEGMKAEKAFKSITCTTGNVSRPVVRPEIQRLSSDKNQLVFYCDIDPLSDISTLYQVTWYRDRFETGSKLMSTTYIPYNSREIFRSRTNLSEAHITLGMTIFCSMSAKKLNITIASEPYFVGFEMTSNNSLKLQYSEEALVSIRLTVPFGCQRQSEECFLGVNMFYMETGADNCLLPVAAALSSCGVRISSWRWNQSYALRLANKHGQNLHSISRTYNIRFKTDEHIDHDFFRNYTLPRDIQVEATSNSSSLNGKECHAICDPHMQTFDGRYYENQNEGTYILYINLKIPVQVQMRTNPCYGFKEGPPFCPCGVAIAAGRDVFVVDRCSIPIKIYMPQCDEGILQGKIKSDGNIYQVHLPSGSWVIITSGISFNIYIYPSLSDHMTTSGLCGYLDSNIQNDFMLRNRTTLPDNNFEDFNSNWLVKPEEDLFNTSNYLYLPRWPSEDYFCICKEYQHGYIFQSVNCSPDSRKFCPESTLNDSVAADCSRKLSSNVNVSVQLDPSDFNVSQSRNDTMMPKRNLTEDSANYECWSYLNSSLLFKKCSEVPDIVPESFANTCTKDALITKTMFWAATHLDNAQKKCIYQVTVNQPLSEQVIKENNVTLNPDEPARNKTTNDTDVYTSALLQELKDMACPMNCTDQGNCRKGQCICWKGYGGNDCSVDLNKAPDVYGIPNRGVCDLHETSCSHASILGYNFADSPYLSCQLSLFQVKRNERKFHDNNSIILKAKWISFAEISCPIVDVRSKRSVEFPDDLDTLAIGYSVAVGNNREIFGRNISLLILDSLCVDCIKAGFDIACTLKDGFNLFNRRCIKKKAPEEKTESGSTVLIISTVVGSVLAVIVIGVIFHYCLILRKRAKYKKERQETAYEDMQEMEDQRETYSKIDEVYDQITDLPDDYLTAQKTTCTADESEDGEGRYDKLGNAEKNVSEGHVYLNTLTTDAARKWRLPLETPICIPKSPMRTIQTRTKMYEYK